MLKFLFYLALIYVIYKIIQIVGRVWFIQSKAKQAFHEQQQGSGQQRQKKQYRHQEGETTIDYVPEDEDHKRNKQKKSGDDYIDYEEVKWKPWRQWGNRLKVF